MRNESNEPGDCWARCLWTGCLGVRDDEPAVLDFDLQALAWIEAGVLEPTARELERRHERRAAATSPGLKPHERLIALRLLNGHAAFGKLIIAPALAQKVQR